MRKHYIILFLLILGYSAISQNTNEIKKLIIDTNQNIDQAVVNKDVKTLQRFYSDDFVFTHGTGTVDGKESWINEIRKPEVNFVSRQHDSTEVELHGDVAILTGKLSVSRQRNDGLTQYAIRYVRVFALRKKDWQLISHRTISEWHH